MKIRLKRTLPIEATHGCLEGTEWEVATVITGGRAADCPRYLFMSEAGQAVVALCYEAEVIDDKPCHERMGYEEYYKQPEPHRVHIDLEDSASAVEDEG